MSAIAYIERLKESRTFQSGVIEGFGEYDYNQLWGILRGLPSVPQANDDRHVIVMDIQGSHPAIRKVLSSPSDTIAPKMRDAGKLIFIFVSVKPEQIKIQSPANGYRLGDGQKISADIRILITIKDIERFWKAAKDPIARIESEIIDEVGRYFLQHASSDLLASPAVSVQELEQQLLEINLDLDKVFTGLSTQITNLSQDNNFSLKEAVDIKRVYVDISLSNQLRNFIERQQNKIFGTHGLLDKRNDLLGRQYIDRQIANDRTFPCGLRELIMALDTSLLENFYQKPYDEAMSRVHARLAEAKAAHNNRLDKEITLIAGYIERAQKIGIDDEDIESLKVELANKMLMVNKMSSENKQYSDSEFIRQRLGTNSFREWENAENSRIAAASRSQS